MSFTEVGRNQSNVFYDLAWPDSVDSRVSHMAKERGIGMNLMIIQLLETGMALRESLQEGDVQPS